MNDLYWLAFSMIPGVGGKTARQLLDLIPNPEDLFSESRKGLETIFGNKTKIIDAILSKSMFVQAEDELKFIENHDIQLLTYTDNRYPQRLRRAECGDTPVVLFYKGTADLNTQRVVSIVGTRKPTDYGYQVTERLVQDMATENILVVSGLAYGIDACSHRTALQHHLPTVGVLGHGLDTIYPSDNRGLAKDMLSNGGLLTEFCSKTKLDPHNFPARNRIIAALSDAVIVVEAAKKGGALITAEIANGYNRDVFAVPGKINEQYSEGCNNLIKTNRANLLQSVQDLYYIMGWKKNEKAKVIQPSLFEELPADQKKVYDLLLLHKELTMDEIVEKSGISLPKIAAILLSLELKNVLKCLPGKIYKIV